MTKKDGGLLSRLRGLVGKKGEKSADIPQPMWVPEVRVERPSNVTPQTHDVNMTALREGMLNHLSLAELHEICDEVELDRSGLTGGKGRQVMAILQLGARAGKVPSLLKACEALKPQIDWQKQWDES